MADSNTTKDQERLAKLWDAYEVQEKELELSIKKLATMEHKIKELDRVNGVLKKAVEDRDKEIRDLEIKVITLEEENSKYQPQFDELNKIYKGEKERYAKLFAITEELEEDLAKTKKESEIKDKWFERNVGMLENIKESIVERNILLNDVSAMGPGPEIKQLGPAKINPTIPLVEDTKPEPPAAAPEPEPEPKKEDDDKLVTFGTVDLGKDSETPTTPQTSAPEPTSAAEPVKADKNETIYEFTKIPDIDPILAESLYNAGYTDLEKLKSSTTEDLAKVEGISPTLARKIRTYLFEKD